MSKQFYIHHRSRTYLPLLGLLVACIASLPLVGSALARSSTPVSAAHGEHLLNIYDKGVERTIVTKARTLHDALNAAKITVDEERDVVEPGLNTELVGAKYSVNIYRARPVVVVDGSHRRQVTTAQQTPGLIAQAAGLTLYPEDEVTLGAADDVALDGASLVMKITRSKVVKLTLYGKTAEVHTRADTVAAFLREKNITLAADDTISASTTAPITSGMHVEIWRNGKQTVTVEEDIDFVTEKVQDADQPTSHHEVKTPGEKGKQNVTYEIEMKNGQEVGRKKIAAVTTKEPKKQVEVVGTKTAVSYNGGGSKDQWLAASNIPRDQWGYAEWLVQKESGWNPNARNASGACGLAQALPCNKVPGNPLDPINSLNWMHGYVMGRYGSWEKAVAHSKSRGWY